MNITLVADIPYKLVLRGGKNVVQGKGEFHHAEVWSKMAAIFCQHGDELMADFRGQSLHLFHREFFDMGGIVHHIEVSIHSLVLILSDFESARPEDAPWAYSPGVPAAPVSQDLSTNSPAAFFSNC